MGSVGQLAPTTCMRILGYSCWRVGYDASATMWIKGPHLSPFERSKPKQYTHHLIAPIFPARVQPSCEQIVSNQHYLSDSINWKQIRPSIC